MASLKRSIRKRDLIIIIIIVFLAIISLVIYSKELQSVKKQENNGEVTISQNEEKKEVQVPRTDEEIVKYLSKLGERDRMEYYCGEYFKHIEKKEYEAAYNLLYPEFKESYFPTLERYEEYVKKTYPSNWALDYEDITRQGDIYVLKLNVLDVLGSKENEKSQRIVIKENNYNNFSISFQVI